MWFVTTIIIGISHSIDIKHYATIIIIIITINDMITITIAEVRDLCETATDVVADGLQNKSYDSNNHNEYWIWVIT